LKIADRLGGNHQPSRNCRMRANHGTPTSRKSDPGSQPQLAVSRQRATANSRARLLASPRARGRCAGTRWPLASPPSRASCRRHRRVGRAGRPPLNSRAGNLSWQLFDGEDTWPATPLVRSAFHSPACFRELLAPSSFCSASCTSSSTLTA
jgi:hypothetical protein